MGYIHIVLPNTKAIQDALRYLASEADVSAVHNDDEGNEALSHAFDDIAAAIDAELEK